MALANSPIYVPTPIQTRMESVDGQFLQKYLQQQLQNIAIALQQTTAEVFVPISAAPSRPTSGMLIYADGTNWNPGSGAGPYIYLGGNWVFLGVQAARATFACKANLNAATQTVNTNTTAQLTLDGITLNEGSYFDNVTNYRWTPPSGHVCISASAIATTFDSANPFTLRLVKNGTVVPTNVVQNNIAQTGGGLQYASLVGYDVANGTDWYELLITNVSGTVNIVMNNNARNTWFEGIAFP
jgi:hypothetical protein